jgi:excinuclease ABC subunit A
MDSLDPVAAGVAVDRRAPAKSSRSTVSTMADLEPYLSAIFYREARPVCDKCQKLAVRFDANTATQRLLRAIPGSMLVVTYPERAESVEAYLDIRERLKADGLHRLWLDGKATSLDDVAPSAALSTGGPLHVIVDRVKAQSSASSRLQAAIEQGFERGDGHCDIVSPEETLSLSAGLTCPECGQHFENPSPGTFSTESPLGACPICRGFGRILGIDVAKVIPDDSLSLAKGAIRPWRGNSTVWEREELAKLCRRHKIDMKVPFASLSKREQQLVLEGDGKWEDDLFPGVIGWFRWLETKTYKLHVRVLLSRYRAYDPCPTCHGQRLSPRALCYRIEGRSIADFAALEVHAALALVESFVAETAQGELARKELSSRLTYLDRVGLGYLRLDRQARTLSGGEAQRVTLTAALGTSLHHALFVLDEPTVGLHPTDIPPLLAMMKELASRNNVVIAIEHDPQVIATADRVVELGPGAGTAGGRITGDATPRELFVAKGATYRALCGMTGESRERERRQSREWLTVRGARGNNLKNLDVTIPLGAFCAVTGPSGSGKSTLAIDTVARAVARKLGEMEVEPALEHDELLGVGSLVAVELVDQSPLGRTSRGNAATYTKAWDTIRKLYAAEPDAVQAGLTASSFSFNVAGGRCDACAGEGAETVEMQFLADVRLSCPECGGKRFQPQVCQVRHRGRSIDELLESTISETLELYASEKAIVRTLGPLKQLGLGYLRLGQPLSTLSGGEAQRLKLARALTESKANTLYLLDEPSAGLHADEVGLVIEALHRLVQLGGSVVVVEHDLDVIRAADWVIDLGPGAGQSGGCVVATGTPETIAQTETKTGQALRMRIALPRTAKTVRSLATTQALTVERAREHNLRDVCCAIPHGKLTVITGPSGSGKSSLAFDVVFAEGQRRFFETLTPYARQFLPTMPRPNVDSVRGVPPTIALEQRTARAGGASTVATITEVAQFLRLLYAKVGVPHCPEHGIPISLLSPAALLEAVHALPKRKIELLAPAVKSRKGTYLDVFSAAAKARIWSAYCDGVKVNTDPAPKLKRNLEHDISLVIAEPQWPEAITAELLEDALRWGDGEIIVRQSNGSHQLLSTKSACPTCGFSVTTLDPRLFSANTRQGRCPTCEGAGTVMKSVKRKGETVELTERCRDCAGTRLSAVARSVRVNDLTYPDLLRDDVLASIKQTKNLRFSARDKVIAEPLIQEILRRLEFLKEVGLGYLALDREAVTLSGGELQRLRLSAQLGAGLTGALYVLDEPTIGLHPRDTDRLLGSLRRLVELGSTVVVVEHDIDTIRAADYLIDLGPGGGTHGGRIVASGSPREVTADPASPTGKALARAPRLREALPVSKGYPMVTLEGAREHNLKGDRFRFPLQRMTVVVGVSGSGKSTLVSRVLLPAVRRALGLVGEEPGVFTKLSGVESLKRALAVDQSPIGRSPRSVPATFLGIWDEIRRLFAATTEAQIQGFGASRFSFNTAKGGRCTHCEGQGVITQVMSFLPDVVTTCPTCNGRRFEPRTLEVKYLGLNIGEVLELSAEQAVHLFENHPSVAAPLRTLVELGTGYIKLGQGSHTLSGGEAQRLKLAAELTAGIRHDPTLYVLDEPTTGLHFADVERLLQVLSRLVERGDTLVIIEHHPQVIASADYLVELGPEAGQQGGHVVAEGAPSKLVEMGTTTGKVIAGLMRR